MRKVSGVFLVKTKKQTKNVGKNSSVISQVYMNWTNNWKQISALCPKETHLVTISYLDNYKLLRYWIEYLWTSEIMFWQNAFSDVFNSVCNQCFTSDFNIKEKKGDGV